MSNPPLRSNLVLPALHLTSAIAIGGALCSPAAAQMQPAPPAQPASAARPGAAATPPSQPPKAPAAAADDGGLETVVVTAQRREELAQHVPIAMSAFSGGEIARRNITDALALTQYVPNLVATNNTGLGTANTYFIRGVGDTESLASKDPPVGTYIDDIYFARQSANNFAYFDVDRIEVLRGPQGTLFGRNTTGGSINVHLKKPSATTKGYVEAGFGSFQQKTLRGGVDAPISPELLTKFSGYYSADDGYVKNTTTGETLNDRKNYGGRFALRALPSQGLTWDAFATYMYAAGSNLVNFECDPAAPANCSGRYATTGLLKNNNGADQYPRLNLANGKGNLPLGNETKTGIVGSNLQLAVGEAKVNFITGIVDTRQQYNLDFFDGRAAPGYTFVADPVTGRPSLYNVANNVSAGGPVRGRPGGFAIAALAQSKQFTQEIKATGSALDAFVEYVGGVFYLNERNNTDFADISTGTGAAVAPPAAPYPVTLLADRMLRNNTQSWAAYSQVDLNFTDQIKLTGGARYTHENKEYNFSDNNPNCRVAPLPATCIDNANFDSVDNDLNPATPPITIPRRHSINILTPRLALNYQLGDDAMVYVSATRGFKSGGQSARSTAVRLLLPFDAETVWSYELGTRTEWLNHRLRVNATAFQATTKNLQGGSAFVTTNQATGAQSLSFVTRNFADFDNKGLEFDITAVPVKGLNLVLAGGLQHARYKLDPNRTDPYGTVSTSAQQQECLAALGGRASPRGDTRLAAARAQSSCGNGVVTPTGDIAKPVRTPRWTVSGGASYDVALPALGATLTPSVNFSFTSAHEVGSANVSIWRNGAGVLNAAGDGQFVTGSYSAAHTLINAGIAFGTDDKLWTGSVDCSNCTDKAFSQASLSNFTYLNAPRTWNVKVKRVF